MARPRKTKNKVEAEKGFCPERVNFRPDADVRHLLNASKQIIDWNSLNHAINAGIRQAYHRYTPPGVVLCVSPFEQLVFAKKITVKRDRK